MSILPVINFSPFLDEKSTPAQKLSTALEIDKACREVGFFYLSHHGIPAPLTDSMLATAKAFFEKNIPEEKEALAIKKGDEARGFSRIDGGVKGTHESLDVFRPVMGHSPPYTTGMGENQWPVKPPNFRSISEEYVSKMLSLATQVLRAIAMGLGVDEKIFTNKTNEAFWNLRIVSYKLEVLDSGNLPGMGQHTDFGILTFLISTAVKNSFQVLSKSGQWIPADPQESCFLVNIGDMLAEWTGNLYKSTLHRVIHRDPGTRYSVPFFFDPNFDARISPVLAPSGSDQSSHRVEILYKDRFIRAMKCV